MKLQHTAAAISKLEEICKAIPGWSPTEQLYTLFTMVMMTSGMSGDILELGSWCGRSSVALGLAAKLCGHTRVHCVDLFPEKEDWQQNKDGSYSMTVTINGNVVQAYHDQTVWQEPFERDMAPLYTHHRAVLDIFMENVSEYDLGDVVVPYKGTLATFSQAGHAANSFRLAFIDGDHGYEAVRADIKLVDRMLMPGGWMCFDDAFTSYRGVDQAIEELIVRNPEYELGQQMTRKLFVARKR